MGEWSLARLSRSLGDRADAIDDLLRAPLSTASREAYRHYLCDVYGFLIAYETRLAFAGGLAINFIAPRIRSGRLAHDLLAVGLDHDAHARLARRCTVPELSVRTDALGWLFAVERMTMRQQGLRQRLAPSLSRELASGGTWLSLDADELKQRWIELGEVLDQSITDESEMAAVVHSARNALDCLEDWTLAVASTSIEVDSRALRFA